MRDSVALATLPVTPALITRREPSRGSAEATVPRTAPDARAKMACGDVLPLGHGHGLQGMKVGRNGGSRGAPVGPPATAAAAAAGGLRS